MLAVHTIRAIADEPAPHFVSDLLHVKEAVHVTPELHVSRNGDRPRHDSIKAVISPEILPSLDAFQGKVYDVSATLRERGMTLPKGSHALYGPQSQTLYIESTPDDVEIAQAMFYSEPPPVEYTADIHVVRKSAGKEEVLLDVKSVPLVDGRSLELKTSGRQSLHLLIGPNFGRFYYGAPFIDIGVEAKVQEGDNSLSMLSSWLMHHSKPREAMLGRLGDATVTLSIQTHSRQGRWGDDPESEKENKAAAIKKIQEELAGKK